MRFPPYKGLINSEGNIVTDDMGVQSSYKFYVIEESQSGQNKTVAKSDFYEQDPVLSCRFAPITIKIERSIRAQVERDMGIGYSITAGGEGLGTIQIQGTHGVGAFINKESPSIGLVYRNRFANFFEAFTKANDKKGREGKPLLQMIFEISKGKWSNLSSESYYVWPESFPQDSRTAARPHAWEWGITLQILAIRVSSPSVDVSKLLDPNAAVKYLTNYVAQLKKIKLKKTNWMQNIKDLINQLNNITDRINQFTQGVKNAIYSVTGLVNSACQSIRSLLDAVDVKSFLNTILSNLRFMLYDIKRTLGQVVMTATMFERTGDISPTLTPLQTASTSTPVAIWLSVGDSPSAIAQKVLGDSTQWPRLISVNNLDYPYFDFSGPNGRPDPSYVANGLKVFGKGDTLTIPLPATTGTVPISPDPFGTDLQDTQTLIPGSPPTAPAETLAGGMINLGNAIIRRLLTPQGKIPWHPEYGSQLLKLVGSPSSLDYINDIVSEVNRCLGLDNRILSVQSINATLDQNTVSIQGVAITPLGPLQVAMPIVISPALS